MSNHTEHKRQLEDFLAPYFTFWSEEILNSYPKDFDEETLALVAPLKTLDDQSLIKLYQGKMMPQLGQEWINLLKDRASLIKLPIFYPDETFQSLPHFSGISDKKYIELNAIIPFMHNRLTHELKNNEFLEFACGKGLTSFGLKQLDQNIHCHGIDWDPEMPKRSAYLHQINHQTPTFEISIADLMQSVPKKVQKPRVVNYGLHTCGDLGFRLMDWAIEYQHQVYFNLQCCFHKCTYYQIPFQETYLTNEALHLANFSLHPMSLKSLHYKKRVKRYRYLFEMFLKDELGRHKPLILKSSTPTIYQHSFIDYAQIQWKRIHDLSHISFSSIKSRLEGYYQSQQHVERFELMFLAGFLREQFARPLEVFIALHKALCLKKQNFEVELIELFPHQHSARNILLLGTRPPVY
jgi:hypothetical protein